MKLVTEGRINSAMLEWRNEANVNLGNWSQTGVENRLRVGSRSRYEPNINSEENVQMIVDKLENASLYFGLGERITAGLRYLKENDCTRLPPGKQTIRGEQIFALVQDNTTKPRTEGKWEAHKKYIDIQFVASGDEEMGYANVNTLKVQKPYDEIDDYALFEGLGSFVLVPPGSFAIFFPEDGHMPGVAVNGKSSAVRKIVVKVAL
jgi:YhcH/YjgK/YiaL family protein